jgi:hypothetical protein
VDREERCPTNTLPFLWHSDIEHVIFPDSDLFVGGRNLDSHVADERLGDGDGEFKALRQLAGPYVALAETCSLGNSVPVRHQASSISRERVAVVAPHLQKRENCNERLRKQRSR